MKKIAFALTGCVMLLAACKETDTTLYLSVVKSTDSIYTLTPVPAAQSHNVLVEEFSGQGCTNCPAGHEILEGIISGNTPLSVNAISYYVYGTPQTSPPANAKYDLRDSVASALSTTIAGGSSISELPSAFIDRKASGGNIVQLDNTWAGSVNSLLTVTDSVNLTVTSSYSASDSMATITTTVTYLQPTTSAQNLCIALVEDSIIDLQEDHSAIDTFYLFTNVFRGMATAQTGFGDPIMPAVTNKAAGQTEQKIYSYKIPAKSPAIVPAHCRIVAFITYGAATLYSPVVQSQQCPLE
jgi:hypothetical protein